MRVTINVSRAFEMSKNIAASADLMYPGAPVEVLAALTQKTGGPGPVSVIRAAALAALGANTTALFNSQSFKGIYILQGNTYIGITPIQAVHTISYGGTMDAASPRGLNLAQNCWTQANSFYPSNNSFGGARYSAVTQAYTLNGAGALTFINSPLANSSFLTNQGSVLDIPQQFTSPNVVQLLGAPRRWANNTNEIATVNPAISNPQGIDTLIMGYMPPFDRTYAYAAVPATFMFCDTYLTSSYLVDLPDSVDTGQIATSGILVLTPGVQQTNEQVNVLEATVSGVTNSAYARIQNLSATASPALAISLANLSQTTTGRKLNQTQAISLINGATGAAYSNSNLLRTGAEIRIGDIIEPNPVF